MRVQCDRNGGHDQLEDQKDGWPWNVKWTENGAGSKTYAFFRGPN